MKSILLALENITNITYDSLIIVIIVLFTRTTQNKNVFPTREEGERDVLR